MNMRRIITLGDFLKLHATEVPYISIYQEVSGYPSDDMIVYYEGESQKNIMASENYPSIADKFVDFFSIHGYWLEHKTVLTIFLVDRADG